MTRKEQMQQAEHKYSEGTMFDGCDYIGQVAKSESFIAGAEWADETMIDKVCKWLYKNTYKHADDSRVSMIFENTIDMIEDFRKAMEE